MIDLPPTIQERLRESHALLSSQGRLLPPFLIEAASNEFRERFGTKALSAIDGIELLEAMHGRGGGSESMVFWLEYKNDSVFPGYDFGGIGGGSAHKFGFFRRKNTGEWEDSSSNAISQEQAIALASEQRRQLAECAGFLSGIGRDLTNDNVWWDVQTTIARLAPELHRSSWAHKYLTVLFPDLLESYHRPSWQRHHLLKLLQLPPGSGDHSVDVSRDLFLCTGRFTELARHFEWPLLHLTAVLNAANGRPHRYWRVGTSIEDVDAWPFMRDGGCAAIGWSQLEDLSEFVKAPQRRELIKQALPECGYYKGDARVASRKAGEISNFIGVISRDDVIAAANGQQIRGLGKIVGEYYYDNFPPAVAPHRRRVQWLVTDEVQLFQSKVGLLTSVSHLTDEDLILEIERALVQFAPSSSTTHPTEEVERPDDEPGPDNGASGTGGNAPPPPQSPPSSTEGPEPEIPSDPVSPQAADIEPDSDIGEPSILSEQPTDKDALGIAPYARGLAAFLFSPHTQTPVTVSIEGPWGMGKTSFLKMVSKELKASSQGDPLSPRRKIVWFNPWRHDAGESLWAAFLYEFAEQTEKNLSFFSRQNARCHFYWEAIGERFWHQTGLFAVLSTLALAIWLGWIPLPKNWDGTISSLIAAFVALGPLAGILIDYIKGLRQDAEKVWKKDDEKERVCAAEKASGRFRKFLAAYLEKDERIYVILDDLDRCAAPKAAELLDSLQLLISGNGNEDEPFPVVFLLALDREKVAAGVAVKFKELLPFVGRGLPDESALHVEVGRDFGYEYLQKFIDVPFRLPAAGPNGIATYIRALAKDAYPGLDAPTPTNSPDTISGPGASPPTEEEEEKVEEDDDLEEGPDQSHRNTSETADAVAKLSQQAAKRLKNNLDLVLAMTVVAPMLENNPRRLKQYLNLLRLRVFLIEATKSFDRNDVMVAHLAKTVAIELARPVLYRHLCEGKQLRDRFAASMRSILTAEEGSLAKTDPRKYLAENLVDLGREDLGWVQRHFQPLVTQLGSRAGFPSEEALDILLHISPPPAEAEAKAAEHEMSRHAATPT